MHFVSKHQKLQFLNISEFFYYTDPYIILYKFQILQGCMVLPKYS